MHTISRYTQGTLTKSFMHGIFTFMHTENFMFHAWKFHMSYMDISCMIKKLFSVPRHCLGGADAWNRKHASLSSYTL